MLDEDRKQGSVDTKTYVQYFRMTGGWPFFLIITGV